MKKHRWLKITLCGVILLFGGAYGLGVWGILHGKVLSREEFEEFTGNSNRSSFGLTRYVGRSGGFDHFLVRLVFIEESLRMPVAESPVKQPYPLRYWPGSWRKGGFRGESPNAEWFMYD